MRQPTLPGVEPMRAPGDDLERGYTPPAVVEACLDVVARYLYPVQRPPARILELHVGGGAWVRAARARWGERPWIGVADLDPAAPGLALDLVDRAEVGDVLDPRHLDRFPEPDLVLGNPPFDPALEHWTAIRRRWPGAAIGWILPWSRWALVGWRRPLLDDPPMDSGPLVPRPWPNIKVRDVGFFLWPGEVTWPYSTGVRPLYWRDPNLDAAASSRRGEGGRP